jgi:hypothetical protein
MPVIGPSNPIETVQLAALLELPVEALAELLLLLLLLPQPATPSAPAAIAAMIMRPFTELTSSSGDASLS